MSKYRVWTDDDKCHIVEADEVVIAQDMVLFYNSNGEGKIDICAPAFPRRRISSMWSVKALGGIGASLNAVNT